MTRLIRTGRSVPAWPKDALRISFGIIWLIDAVLKWLPGFRSGYMSMLMSQAQGQPGWLKPWFTFWINLQHPRVIFFAYFVAIETLIAVAVIIGFARKLTYISAAVFSVIIWATAEGFGGLFANAPGARVSPAEAARLGSQVPASAVVSPARTRSHSPVPASGSPSWPARAAARMRPSGSPA